jgi:transcriptional regulator
LPILLKNEQSTSSKLIGHLAARNPHAQELKDGDSVTVLFHGPHTYITPKWYAENDVPTWNYAVVHVHGRIRWIREFNPLLELLGEMTDFFEDGSPDPWRFFLPDDLKSPEVLTNAIVGFEIEIESIESKFKLSQNRSLEDRTGVIAGLEKRSDEMSMRVRELMENLRSSFDERC